MNRNIWIAAAVIVVISVAVVIVIAPRPRDQPGTTGASPTASASASVARPSSTTSAPASPSPTNVGTIGPTGGTGASGVYNDDFGFIVTDVGAAAAFRKESSNARLASFDQQGFAVSPDGRFTAFWKPGSPVQLRVTGGASEQTYVTLAAGVRGGGIAWSSDGAGLLYSTETGNFGIGGGTNSANLNIYEVAPNGRHGTVIDTQANTGWLYRPLAWDRSANLAAAGLTGEGAGMAYYLTLKIDPSAGASTVNKVDTRGNGMDMGGIHASSDAKFVLGTDGTTGNVKFWPVGDYAANKTAAGTGRTGAQWQPGTHKIGFISADASFVLFTADDGSASTVFRGVKPGSTVRMFRADGTAVVLAFVPEGSSGLGSTDYTFYRLSDGASVTFQELGGLMASVHFF
jgi:hypothetical protein